jgi:hypothetical protein
VGQRFSLTYLTPGKLTQDNNRFRGRIAAYVRTDLHPEGFAIRDTLGQKLGAHIACSGPGICAYKIADYLASTDLPNFLDAITVIYKAIWTRPGSYDSYTPRSHLPQNRWIRFVRRVIDKEKVGYRIDDAGGVHPLVDQEFEHNRVSALACLDSDTYTGVRAAFEKAHEALEQQDTKNAVRQSFEAVEILVRMTIPCQNLSSAPLRQHLLPKVRDLYDDNTARTVVGNLIESLCDWVGAAHFYRHGQPGSNVVEPPLDLAVMMVSQSASYLRWLIGIHRVFQGDG